MFYNIEDRGYGHCNLYNIDYRFNQLQILGNQPWLKPTHILSFSFLAKDIFNLW